MSGMTNDTESDLAKLGYRVVLGGDLAALRDKLRMSRNAQARLIGVDGESLRKWEMLDRAMNIETAVRIGEWFWAAEKAIEHMSTSEPKVKFDKLIPISRAAQYMGVGQADLQEMVDQNAVQAEQLGVLGTFIYRTEMNVPAGI